MGALVSEADSAAGFMPDVAAEATEPSTLVTFVGVGVHPVDLDAGATFADLPTDFLEALLDDDVGKRSGQETPALHLAPEDSARTWDVEWDGSPLTVTGALADLAAWMAGRPAPGSRAEQDDLPTLPAWL